MSHGWRILLLVAAASACARPLSAPPRRTAVEGGNPFAGARLWVDPQSRAAGLTRQWRTSRPDDARAIEKIARQPVALWVGDWNADAESYVRRRVNKIAGDGALPVFVLYNIPNRDCGQHSAGGAGHAGRYRAWIEAVARGIGSRPAVVILEPDALPQLTDCLSPEARSERIALIRHAVEVFRKLDATAVYVDAGHSDWVPAPEMARRLRVAGIEGATGFSLNVSNYKTTEAIVAYGAQVSAAVGGKPFVIDTSRNGNGPPPTAAATEASWCNPQGRALGAPPTADTGHPLVHAFLWIKAPGESDGECNGGPKAGDWWTEQALGLARRARF